MTDIDRLSENEARLAKVRDLVNGDCNLNPLNSRWLMEQYEEAREQLAKAKPYQEFVEAMLRAAESQDCADCPNKCEMPDCYCDQAADAWQAWQERRGK